MYSHFMDTCLQGELLTWMVKVDG